MALSRSFLKGMGLTEEQVSAIIEAHTESTDALKGQRDEYKEKAEKLANIEKEFDEFKATSTDVDEWKAKFEKEHKAFNDYKAALESEKAKEAKVNAYKALLTEAKISDKLIELVVKANAADIDALELDEHGAIKDADNVKNSIVENYADYITDSSTEGAKTPNPPGNDGKEIDLNNLSIEEYIAARKQK